MNLNSDTIWLYLALAAAAVLVWFTAVRDVMADDAMTIQLPQVYLAWDNQTADGYEIQIAQNGCHGGGHGLTRVSTLGPESKVLIGDIRDILQWVYPVYMRVRSRIDTEWSEWTAQYFRLDGG